MGRRKGIKVPRMTKGQRMMFAVINFFAILVSGLVAINTLFDLDLSRWVMALLALSVSGWLMVQGGWKVLLKLSKRAPSPEGWVHVMSFAVGLVMLFVAFLSLPPVGTLMSLNTYSWAIALTMFIGMVMSIVEIFV